jgi:hypothetical protein
MNLIIKIVMLSSVQIILSTTGLLFRISLSNQEAIEKMRYLFYFYF